jgi:hypothetical protein
MCSQCSQRLQVQVLYKIVYIVCYKHAKVLVYMYTVYTWLCHLPLPRVRHWWPACASVLLPCLLPIAASLLLSAVATVLRRRRATIPFELVSNPTEQASAFLLLLLWLLRVARAAVGRLVAASVALRRPLLLLWRGPVALLWWCASRAAVWWQLLLLLWWDALALP